MSVAWFITGCTSEGAPGQGEWGGSSSQPSFASCNAVHGNNEIARDREVMREWHISSVHTLVPYVNTAKVCKSPQGRYGMCRVAAKTKIQACMVVGLFTLFPSSVIHVDKGEVTERRTIQSPRGHISMGRQTNRTTAISKKNFLVHAHTCSVHIVTNEVNSFPKLTSKRKTEPKKILTRLETIRIMRPDSKYPITNTNGHLLVLPRLSLIHSWTLQSCAFHKSMAQMTPSTAITACKTRDQYMAGTVKGGECCTLPEHSTILRRQMQQRRGVQRDNRHSAHKSSQLVNVRNRHWQLKCPKLPGKQNTTEMHKVCHPFIMTCFQHKGQYGG